MSSNAKIVTWIVVIILIILAIWWYVNSMNTPVPTTSEPMQPATGQVGQSSPATPSVVDVSASTTVEGGAGTTTTSTTTTTVITQ